MPFEPKTSGPVPAAGPKIVEARGSKAGVPKYVPSSIAWLASSSHALR